MTEKTIPQKMFIKENMRVLLVNFPADGLAALTTWPAGVNLLEPDAPQAEAILLLATCQKDLEQHLPAVFAGLIPGGLLWVLYFKGTSKKRGDIHRDSISAYAQSLGWTGVAMISVDEDLSALRLKPIVG